ncbi:MAG TPA: type IX secretion system sortase PorU [Ignavibacteriaceae bacterium]|nr:type IX secretion system sortase PorU [Ignavibacteriaceae bacterium]
MKSSIFIIIFLICYSTSYSQNSIKIVNSNNIFFIGEFSAHYSDTSLITINGTNYINLSLKDGNIPENHNQGLPAIPEVNFILGVPQEFGNTIEVLSYTYKDIQGRLAPIPRFIREGEINNIEYRLADNYSSYIPENELIKFGESGLSRNIQAQNFILMPVKYFPNENKIRIYDKIVFKINYASNANGNVLAEDELLESTLLNYNAARYWNKQITRLKKVSNSVLATGTWYKFEAPEESIYKIDKNQLASLGISSDVDPRTIKIYNNGGKELPETVNAPVVDDLQENAILVVGEEDGVFNDNDYILFYGRGTNFWDFDTTLHRIVRRFHHYSKENYFLITSGGASGKRMTNKVSSTNEPNATQTSTKAFAFLDEDKINLAKSSRIFLGDEFTESTKSRTYMNKLDGIIPSVPVTYNFTFVNTLANAVSLDVEENSNLITSFYLPGNIGEYSTGIAYTKIVQFNWNVPDDRSLLKFTYNASGITAKGYLDYFEISYEKTLTPAANKLIFYAGPVDGTIQYNLSGFPSSNIKVFDISDHANVKVVTEPQLWSGGDFQFRAVENTLSSSKYLAIGDDTYKSIINPVQVSNSNLHGIQDGAQFIIVTNKLFREQADRLKQQRETNELNKLSTIVVDIDEITNEFSAGIKDVSGLRNFVKYAYQNWTTRPQFLLLFGDGDYDYKNIEGYSRNFIYSYQNYLPDISLNLDHLWTYSTDDYFARVNGNDLMIDLALGRLNVQTPSDGEAVVNKIIQYENSAGRGTWKNLITLVADDGYTSSGYEGALHTMPSETIATTYIPKQYDIKKIYMAAYAPQVTGSGRRKPQVTKDLISTLNEGTLIMNYYGHGNPSVWTHEYVLEKNSFIPQLTNEKYPFLLAGTCDFGYFDDPTDQSGAEMFVLKRDGGMIAVFTATRLSYAQSNAILIENIFNSLLNQPKDSIGLSVRLGLASFRVKQVYISDNDQKYHILGDPTLKLDIPRYTASIDSINGQPFTTVQQLKALSNVRISGSIKKPNGTPWTEMNGEGILSVYDSERQTRLQEINYDINLQGGVIFRGRVSIINGQFSANFVVPKDISYENRNGRITFYFYDINDEKTDGIGYTNNFTVGGTDSSSSNDNKGPEIDVYFDDENYKNALLVNSNSKLIVHLTDETGLNTTGTGIGHKTEGILNGRENDPIDFTNYFEGDLDSGGKSGKITYQLNNLENGEHSLLVKAWDVFNNFSSESVNFKVVSSDELTITDVLNYPNPFSSNTSFTFQQNLRNPLDVKISVYTVAGRLIKKIESFGLTAGFVNIDWDGRDEDGNVLANGTYLYKISIKTIDGKLSKSVLGKLAIIR